MIRVGIKAKNLNELVSGVEKKKKSKILSIGNIQYPVRGKIISKYGKKSVAIAFFFFLGKGILWLLAAYFGFGALFNN